MLGKVVVSALSLGVLPVLFMPPTGGSYRPHKSKETAARIRAAEWRRQSDVSARKKPIIDLAMQGDYASAFKALETEGPRHG